MPVFTFEKITPPIRRVSDSTAAAEKPRGVIVQILDRLVGVRVKPDLREETNIPGGTNRPVEDPH
jgi:hypothetical protein